MKQFNPAGFRTTITLFAEIALKTLRENGVTVPKSVVEKIRENAKNFGSSEETAFIIDHLKADPESPENKSTTPRSS